MPVTPAAGSGAESMSVASVAARARSDQDASASGRMSCSNILKSGHLCGKLGRREL